MTRLRKSEVGVGVQFAPVFLLLALLAVVGCGPRSDRLSVSGEVLLDGVPLDSGSIQFTSVGGEKLVSSGAMVQSGVYQIPQEKGLLPGTYHVEITSPDTKSPPIIVRQSPGGPGLPVQPDRIPKEYNVESDKQVEVTIDGDNKFDFDIASKPAAR